MSDETTDGDALDRAGFERLMASLGVRLDLARRDAAVGFGGGPEVAAVVAVPWVWNDPSACLCRLHALCEGPDGLFVVSLDRRVRHARLRRFDEH